MKTLTLLLAAFVGFSPYASAYSPSPSLCAKADARDIGTELLRFAAWLNNWRQNSKSSPPKFKYLSTPNINSLDDRSLGLNPAELTLEANNYQISSIKVSGQSEYEIEFEIDTGDGKVRTSFAFAKVASPWMIQSLGCGYFLTYPKPGVR